MKYNTLQHKANQDIANTINKLNAANGIDSRISARDVAAVAAAYAITPTASATPTSKENTESAKKTYSLQPIGIKMAYEKTQENDVKSNINWDEYTKAEDFSELSKATESKRKSGLKFWKSDDKYDFINDIDNYRLIISALSAGSGEREKYGNYTLYSHMNDKEVGIYNYLYAKEGKDKAEEYLSDITDTLNSRYGKDIYDNMTGIRKGLYWLPTGVDQWAGGIKQALSEKELPASPIQYAGQEVQKEADEKSAVLGSLNKAGVMIGNMLPSILLSRGTSSVLNGLGASAKVIKAASGAAGALSVGASSGGNAYGQALKEGYSKEQAAAYGKITGASEGLLQYLLGGISDLGGISSSKILGKVATIKNTWLKVFAKYGIQGLSEVTEEEAQLYLEPLYRKFIFGEEYEAPKMQEVLETALITMFTTGILNGGSDISRGEVTKVEGVTTQEAKVLRSEAERLIKEQESNGQKLSKKQKNEIRKSLFTDLQRGYIDIETIERALGEGSYTAYQEAVKNKAENINELKKQLRQEVFNKVQKSKSNNLIESYRDLARAEQTLAIDDTKYQGSKNQDAVNKTIENARKAGLNNTNRTRDLFDLAVKASADKGLVFDFADNETLKATVEKQLNDRIEQLANIPTPQRTEAQSQELKNLSEKLTKVQSGKITVDGNITNNGITLNLDSERALNTIVGHEVTHSLEGTEHYKKLQDAIFEYAKTKKEYQSRLNALKERYKGIETTDEAILEELTSDLVGDYLFDDYNFVLNLAKNHRNVFQKIFDEIKYLCKIATAGSKELRALEKAKHNFEKAYQETSDVTDADTDRDTKFALSYEDAIDKLEDGTFDTTKNTHLKVLEHTPQIYIDKAKASDREIVMSWDIAYLAMNKNGNISGNYHGLGADIMKALPAALEDPLYIVKQKNGRIAAVTKIVVKGKRAVFASIELEAYQTTIQEGETEAKKYNLVVTVTDAKPNYLQNTIFSGKIVYNKNSEDPAHFILRLKSLEKALPTYDLAESSNKSIPQNSEKSTENAKKVSTNSSSRNALSDSSLDNNGNKGYNYTKEQYEQFGWAREADALTKTELDDLYSKIQARYTLRTFKRSSKGEAIVKVNNEPHTKLGVNNVFVFVKGTKNNFKISRVVRFDAQTEVEMEIYEEAIYERGTWSDSYLPYFEQEGFAEEYRRENFKSFEQYQQEARRRSSGQESRGADKDNRGPEEHGSGHSQAFGENGETTVRYALSDEDVDGYNLAQNSFENDQDAIYAYKSSESYKINDALRNNYKLSDSNVKLIKRLDKQLEETPTYEGVVYRNLSFDFSGQKALDDFVAMHIPGEYITYPAYTSTSKSSDGYPIDAELAVHIKIYGINGHDISKNYGIETEKEVLFGRNSSFYICSVSYDGKTANIIMEEDYEQRRVQSSNIGDIRGKQRSSDSSNKASSMQQVQTLTQGKSQSSMQGVSERDTERDISQRGRSQEAVQGGQRSEVRTQGQIKNDNSDERYALSETDTDTDTVDTSDSVGKKRQQYKASIKERIFTAADSYSYDTLTKKNNLTVVAFPAELPMTEDGRVDTNAVVARGRLNARKQKNPNNTDERTYVHIGDIGLDVLLSKKGMVHGIARSQETAFAVMKIGDVLKNSVAVNELNGSATRKTEMSYVLLGACRDSENIYVVRSVVSKLENNVTEIDVYQLGAVKGKKTETPTSALGGTGVKEQNALVSSESPAISIADFLEYVKTIPIANEVFSKDVAKKIGVEHSKGSLSGDIRYALSDNNFDSASGMVHTVTKKTAKETISDGAAAMKNGVMPAVIATQIQFTNQQAGIEYAGKKMGVKDIEKWTNNARASRAQAQEMLGGKICTVRDGKIIDEGDGLGEILNPIKAKGRDYEHAFYASCYHAHNIDRMLLEKRSIERNEQNKQKLKDMQDKLNELKHDINTNNALLEKLKNSDNVNSRIETTRIREKLKSLKAEHNALNKATKKLKKTIDEFVPEANKPVLAKEINGEKVALTAEESQAILEEYDKRYPEFKQHRQKLYGYNDALMRKRVDAGLITEELYIQLKEKYPHYVPTFREQTEQGTSGISGKYNLAVKKTIGKARGSLADLMPLDKAIARMTEQTVTACNINKLVNVLVDASEAKGDTRYLEEVKRGKISLDESISKDGDDTEQDIPKTNQISAYRNGEKITYSVTPEVFAGFDAFNSKIDTASLPIKTLQWSTSVFKKLVTSLNPFFSVRNSTRDIQEAGVNTKYPKVFLKNYARAIDLIRTNSKLFQLYRAFGGLNNTVFDYEKGFTGIQNKYGFAKPDNKILSMLTAMERVNMFIEQIPRFAEFISSIEAGSSPEQAVLDAADVTTNFGRTGKITKALNSTVIPFLNPSIQGLSKITRNIRDAFTSAEAFGTFAIKLAIVGVIPQIVNYLFFKDDDDYEKLRDTDKENNYLFKVGDTFIKIPKGRVASVLAGLTNRTTQELEGKNADWKDYFDNVISQITPVENFARPIWQPVIDATNNKTWYGTKIEGQQFENTRPEDRYDESTSSIAIAMGKITKTSPKKWHYVIDQYSGIIGDILLPMTTPKAENDLIKGNFVLDPTTSNKLSTNFYKLYEEAQYKKTDGDIAAKYQVKYLNKVKKSINELYDQKAKIHQSDDLNNSEKLQQARIIQALINTLYQDVMDNYDSYTKAIAMTQGYYDEETEEDIRQAEITRIVYGSKQALKEYNEKVYEKCELLNLAGVDYDKLYYYYFSTKGLTSDTDRRGNVISGSKKKKVIAAINALGVSREQRLLLIASKGYSLTDSEKKRLLSYILKLKTTKEKRIELAELCGFTVRNGKIVANFK